MMKANAYQKKLIHINTPNRSIKELMVQSATGDPSKTSCNDLSFTQANKILIKLGKKPVAARSEDHPLYWGYFDRSKSSHLKIQSLLHQLSWTTPNTRYGRVPDLERFGNWLQSDKAPVQKPLKRMNPQECTKTIVALEGIIKSKYK